MVVLRRIKNIAICLLMISAFSKNAYADVRWEQQGETWYCYDDNNVPLSGWVDYKNEDYFIDANGVMLASQLTPDGHYVDHTGKVLTYENSKDMFNQLEQGIMNSVSSESDIYVSRVSKPVNLTEFRNQENKELQDVIQQLHMFNKEMNMSDELSFYIRVTENKDQFSIRVKGSSEDLAKWKAEQTVANAKLDEMAQNIQGATDTEKFNNIVNILSSNVAYDYTFNNTSPYDGLTNQGTVCNGTMKLFMALARRVGLESKLVVGYANDQLHGWNQVKLDGQWYYTDVTWYTSSKNPIYLLMGPEEQAKRSIIQFYE